MENRSPKVYILDIIECFNKIEKYTYNLSFDDFTGDQKTVDAVIRNFEIVGEASKNVPEDLRVKYPEIPWKEMAGMRDRIIHEYFGINLKIVWRAIQEDIPQAKHLIEKVLKDLEE